MRHNASTRTFGYLRPAKIQISLRIRAVWSESSLDEFFDSQWYKVSSREQQNHWSDCENAQDYLNIRWVLMLEGRSLTLQIV